jgi:hypothetical protein
MKLRQAGIIQVELKRARFCEAVSLQVIKDLFIKIEFANLRFSCLGQCDLSAFELQWIHPYEHGEIIKFFFEILVDDIAAFSHFALI